MGILTKEDFISWDGLDAAIVGYAYRCSEEPVLVYSYQKMVDIFVEQGMEDGEAREWIDFNIAGAWIGEDTPLILESLDEE